MKIQAGRWYWTREGLIAWIRSAFAGTGLLYPFTAETLFFFTITRVICEVETFAEDGRAIVSEETEWDLICKPASRERIVFPHPSTCPRWLDALNREKKDAEEVLFD